MYSCLLISHGRVAESLISATEQILGECKNLYALDCGGYSTQALCGEILNFIDTHELPDGLFILVGLRGGSCWNAAATIITQRPNIELISGMNLPMILTFITKRGQYRFEEFADVLVEYGTTGITRFVLEKLE